MLPLDPPTIRRWNRALLVASGIALTSAGHYLTPADHMLWHTVFQRLYYLPIVYAALSFGWAGGLAAALVSAFCYVPHIFYTWSNTPHYYLHQYAEILVFVLVGGLTGVLSDRDRRREAQLARVNRELQDSFEQIRRADRLSAIGQLSAGLAHEIRNPLASIEGAAEIMDESSGPGELREFRGIILKECRRLNRLLTNLLDFARPRPPEMAACDVPRILDSVIDLWRHSAGKSRVTIRTAIEPGLPPLECDSEQLKQVVLNLVINATQAMPEGGEILIAARRDGDRLAIEVQDQGVGVSGDAMDKIFNPFYTTKEQGTGLGLSVVQQIVAQHGGDVTARRNQGPGMTFTVYMPLEKEGKAA